MERTVIIVTYGNKGTEYLSDLWRDQKDGVIVLTSPFKEIHSRALELLRRACLSSKVNRIINVPYKHKWYALDSFPWQADTKYLILFAGVWRNCIDPKYLNELRKRLDIKYALLILDSMNSPVSYASKVYIDAVQFDYIFTFDPADAEHYHYLHTMSIYSKQDIPNANCDLFFIGAENGRLELLKQISEDGRIQGAISKLNVWNASGNIKEGGNDGGITYIKKRMPYSQVIHEIQKSNCILEVLRTGQSGASQRYYEAICYNKKLLTNNTYVLSFPFYNPKFIKVFERPEDIDWGWVKERSHVDYHYDGRFSPTHLIDRIIELEEEKENKGFVQK